MSKSCYIYKSKRILKETVNWYYNAGIYISLVELHVSSWSTSAGHATSFVGTLFVCCQHVYIRTNELWEHCNETVDAGPIDNRNSSVFILVPTDLWNISGVNSVSVSRIVVMK